MRMRKKKVWRRLCLAPLSEHMHEMRGASWSSSCLFVSYPRPDKWDWRRGEILGVRRQTVIGAIWAASAKGWVRSLKKKDGRENYVLVM